MVVKLITLYLIIREIFKKSIGSITDILNLCHIIGKI